MHFFLKVVAFFFLWCGCMCGCVCMRKAIGRKRRNANIWAYSKSREGKAVLITKATQRVFTLASFLPGSNNEPLKLLEYIEIIISRFPQHFWQSDFLFWLYVVCSQPTAWVWVWSGLSTQLRRTQARVQHEEPESIWRKRWVSWEVHHHTLQHASQVQQPLPVFSTSNPLWEG